MLVAVESRRIPQPARIDSPRLDDRRHGRRADQGGDSRRCSRADRPMQVVRGLWSTAGIGDEVVEVFSAHGACSRGGAAVREPSGSCRWTAYGVPTTTIVANTRRCRISMRHSSPPPSAYFLATLPNAGAEALLSHLTVGAHARLAEDGRKAVAQMGNQQRASADVLIMFGQAIEREQRRMRSFERFMPAPVDPMLHSRIARHGEGHHQRVDQHGHHQLAVRAGRRTHSRPRRRRSPRADTARRAARCRSPNCRRHS